MAQKNYTTHTTEDIKWLSTKLQHLSERMDSLSSRLKSIGLESIPLLDRATLDCALQKVCDWTNKATTEVDDVEVCVQSPQLKVEAASRASEEDTHEERT